MFDLKTKIIIGIGAGLLFAAIVLICVVLSLFFKVSSILKYLAAPRLSLPLSWVLQTECGGHCGSKICLPLSQRIGRTDLLLPTHALVCFFLRAAKECCPTKFQSKIIPPKGTMESCPALPCCDEYSLYADYNALPPCYCGTNEGL
ncbi:protein FAM24A-like [Marmota marmota marmota]|uniref:protein FAM24A-like n=1 Tax=Marmota marmota marmota TaxID=9994 RepID=UPI002093E31B|nr:protein FAM24A-like [Marmota marmota marmota]